MTERTQADLLREIALVRDSQLMAFNAEGRIGNLIWLFARNANLPVVIVKPPIEKEDVPSFMRQLAKFADDMDAVLYLAAGELWLRKMTNPFGEQVADVVFLHAEGERRRVTTLWPIHREGQRPRLGEPREIKINAFPLSNVIPTVR